MDYYVCIWKKRWKGDLERTGEGVRIAQSVQQLSYWLDDEGIMASSR
jgi:hypothetical protein